MILGKIMYICFTTAALSRGFPITIDTTEIVTTSNYETTVGVSQATTTEDYEYDIEKCLYWNDEGECEECLFENDDGECEDDDYDINDFLHATPVTFPKGSSPRDCCKEDDFMHETPDFPFSFCMITSESECGARNFLGIKDDGTKFCGRDDRAWVIITREVYGCVQIPNYNKK